MTERELLESAAKAAGIDAEFHEELGYGPEGMWLKGKRSPDNSKYWSPLSDDGDALRLAVKLKIPLQFPDFQDIACTWGAKDDLAEYIEAAINHNGDLAAATRRAITRAAAEIGRARDGGEMG